ncbi:shikimate dehydrogenase [Arhodomonas aquaeolei]|uniref:shikimate dehydrogenase n=1 Tax=Arhodomonas aquaeolei TaxID=2369 RepID=UPI0003A184AF|nr:shikimate dehydrogenase [Arhodomonas aquaeolei]
MAEATGGEARVDRYAVMGNPIAHSRSPEIHRRFAEQTGEAIRYERILVPEGGFAGAVAEFEAAGGAGLNVTVPFKGDAWALADTLSDRAERARAVNTLIISDAGLYGDNTDGIGLVRDLRDNHGVTLAGARVLILGAGGAARGALPSLLEEAPASVHVANRTAERARELAAAFADLGTVTGSGYETLAEMRFDVVINATSAGLTGELPPLPDTLLAPGACCYDMVYADELTAFVRWARTHGAAVAADGLGMLVEQAAESFFLWRGHRPRTAPVIEALRGA